MYGKNKTVSIQYDTPYIKGLPIKVKFDEINEHGEAVTRGILSSYEDAYTAEEKKKELRGEAESKDSDDQDTRTYLGSVE